MFPSLLLQPLEVVALTMNINISYNKLYKDLCRSLLEEDSFIILIRPFGFDIKYFI